MKHVELIADGSCLSRPTGPGGWACILRYKNTERVLTGGTPVTTSNQMELKAVTMGLRALTEPCEVSVVTDSKYVQQGFTQMLPVWDRSGWRNSRGRPLANQRLWAQLRAAARRHRISWRWVKGHWNHENQNRCDCLARKAARSAAESAA
jgi:ribonuclease HI